MLVTLIALASGRAAFSEDIQGAAASGNMVRVSALLNENPARTRRSGHLLHYAAVYCHKDVVGLLLANKADFNVKDKHRVDASARRAVAGPEGHSRLPASAPVSFGTQHERGKIKGMQVS